MVDLLKGEPTPRDLKYAVLHLQAAVEVILKARLTLEHWSQVLTDPSTADVTRFEEGKFLSCDVQTTITRLSKIARVEIGAADQRAIKSLAETRNALQHYGLTDSALAIEARAANVLHFLVEFIHQNLIPGLSQQEREEVMYNFLDVETGVMEVKKYVAVKMNNLRAGALKDLMDRTIQCARCGHFAFVTGPAEALGETHGVNYCRLCGLAVITEDREDGQHLVSLYSREFHDSEPPEVESMECPSCHRYAFLAYVHLADNESIPRQFCFFCSFRAEEELSPCPHCRRYVDKAHDIAQCRGPRPRPQPAAAL
ncbi:hypothetical protein [Streptomyces sp. NPDC054865]